MEDCLIMGEELNVEDLREKVAQFYGEEAVDEDGLNLPLTELFTMLDEAIDAWGEVAQIIQTIEELSELIPALTHYLRGEENIGQIIDELADVEIMCMSLRVVFMRQQPKFGDLCNEVRLGKLKRLRRRLDEHWESSETKLEKSSGKSQKENS